MYPGNLESVIGFDEIRDLLLKETLGREGADRVASMEFIRQPGILDSLLAELGEFKKICLEDAPFPLHAYPDPGPVFNRLGIEGMFLAEEDFFLVYNHCSQVSDIADYCKKRKETCPNLNQHTRDLESEKRIQTAISKFLDEQGHIRESASPLLLKISKDIRALEQDIHKRLVSAFKKAKEEGWAGETDISVREGRLVIPLLAEHKKKIRGLVHDESASGKVLYMEPVEIVEANNKLRHLYFDKTRETERILREQTDWLRPFLPDLRKGHTMLGTFDFIRSKALLAIRFNAAEPLRGKGGRLKWFKAFHPLLYLHLKKFNREPVSLDLELNEDQRILVISGPNAGGKSVALKTIALNQYMFQCGLQVCTSPDSEFCLFNTMMADIGDGQSIDQNLSSYSAHLRAMNHFLENAGRKALFFIDELGSGTDPQFGGAIGQAVLEGLNKSGSYGVVTTHFSNIKNFAAREPGFLNGSMLYDSNRYEPLYQLITGKPGSSYALELAEKTGLDKNLLKKARLIAGESHQQAEETLAEYQKALREIKKTEKKLAEKEQFLDKLTREYEDLKLKLQSRKADILDQARQQALEVLSNANRLTEQTIREIRSEKANPVITKGLRKKLEQEREMLRTGETNEKPPAKIKEQPESKPSFEPGQLVRIKEFNTIGKIIQTGKEYVLVETGLIKSRLKFEQIEPMASAKIPEGKQRIKGYNYSTISREFSPRLDVRGMTTEEAIKKTMDLVDQALVLSVDKLWILHGKGDGILRKMIRESLKKISHVRSIENEHADFGGDGVTIVTLS